MQESTWSKRITPGGGTGGRRLLARGMGVSPRMAPVEIDFQWARTAGVHIIRAEGGLWIPPWALASPSQDPHHPGPLLPPPPNPPHREKRETCEAAPTGSPLSRCGGLGGGGRGGQGVRVLGGGTVEAVRPAAVPYARRRAARGRRTGASPPSCVVVRGPPADAALRSTPLDNAPGLPLRHLPLTP